MADHADKPEQDESSKAHKPSRLAQLWAKTGLDGRTVSMMLKGSTAPTIAIAMYQSNAVAGQYGLLGYLVAIMSILGMAIMPRGKFIQNMLLLVITSGLGAALNLLALYCATQARAHTTNPGSSPTAYNSSASVVCAIWLIFQVYSINALRAARPQFQFPAIIFSIFSMVSMTYGPSFPNMAVAIAFIKQLLEAFLTGFALATGVHFFIFPVTSRQVVFAEMKGYMMCMSGVLKAQAAFMQSLEEIDLVSLRQQQEAEAAKKPNGSGAKKDLLGQDDIRTPTGTALKQAMLKAIELHAKLNGDVPSAKREVAFGKLESKDITELWKTLRRIVTPVMGLTSILDILQRFGIEKQWTRSDLPEETMQRNRDQVAALRAIMRALHEPYGAMLTLIDSGVSHANILLELTAVPKKKPSTSDEENKGDEDSPGSAKFMQYYKRKLDQFETSKQVTLEIWCREKGTDLPADFFTDTPSQEQASDSNPKIPQDLQSQLFLLIYVEFLLLKVGQAVLDVILLAEKFKQQGRFTRRKLIFPGSKTLYKWLKAVFGKEDMSHDDHFMSDMDIGGSEALYLGESFQLRQDPERLPPQNAREKIGEVIRRVPTFFQSDASSFGFRVTCATMSVAVMAYIQQTQQFFLQQRLLWSMIMIAISMSRTAGQSTFNYVLRVAGTAVAMVGTYLIWYIVDGQTPGVIVLLWLWMTLAFYIVFKFPKFIVVGILSVVTAILIVGYELQVVKVGVQASESNGQPAYPLHTLAPYRLATVAGGLFVAWIWTIFPYPISEHSELRKDLGASLYLLANFYSIVHETVLARAKGMGGDMNHKGTHAYNLERAKAAVFAKSLALLAQLEQNTAFSKFQVHIGGAFPKDEYDGMIECVRRIIASIALMSRASETLSASDTDSASQTPWSEDAHRLVLSMNVTSNSVTSILSLLSSSLTNGQSLPPYVELPDRVHSKMLNVPHVADPEYSALVVVEFCSKAVVSDLAKLYKHVKTLVGVIDFSFHAISTTTQSSETSLDSVDGKQKPQ